MAAEVNKVVTGEYNPVGKSIIYGDTDSCILVHTPLLMKEIEAGNPGLKTV